jgi:predicted esterase
MLMRVPIPPVSLLLALVSVSLLQAQPATEKGKAGFSTEQSQQAEKAAQAFFAAKEAEREKWKFDAAFDRLLTVHEDAVRRIVWKAYQTAPIHECIKKDFDKKEVRHDRHLSAYTVKTVGKRPDKGWPLFIAMHGGGGAPKSVNDVQWKHMQEHYKDQPSATGYQYLALRAPNDTWNGFYDGYVPPLVISLIRQFVLFGDVNTDKVFLMGYSHGGYGAFYIGPKIPDRFAAIHSSAAAPSDGAISPKTLRNTRFTFMIGEMDTAYGRAARCQVFDEAIQKLKDRNKGDYPVTLEFMKGRGHTNLPDHDKIKDMAPHTRNPVPRRLTWELTDSVIRHFFWLSVSEAGSDRGIDAAIKGNAIEISTRNIKHFALELDSRLIALDQPLRISVDGKIQELKPVPQLLTLCRSLLERGDPALAFTCRIPLNADKK